MTTTLPVCHVWTALWFPFDPPDFWEPCQCSPPHLQAPHTHTLAPLLLSNSTVHGADTFGATSLHWHRKVNNTRDLLIFWAPHLSLCSVFTAVKTLATGWVSPPSWATCPSSNTQQYLSSPSMPAIWRTGGYKVSTISVQLISWH